MADWQDELDRLIDGRFEQMVEMRRHFHRHPEVSGQEFETSLLLYQELGNRGFQVRLGPEGRGVIADWAPPENGHARGIFAIRADIDALRIQDEKNVAYHSQHAGIMHACGHDGHTAIAFGAISAIAELHEQGRLPFRPRIRGVFQPAEETCEGAVQMIDAGALEGVSAIIATHVDPTRPVGRIGVRSGVFTANCDEMYISIHGRGGHAARPHETRDPITAAAQLINWLYLQIPRATDSQDAVVVTIGKIEGGHTANVIPERIDLQGTLRTLNRDVRQRTMDQVRQLAHAVSEGSQTEVKVTFGIGSNSVENDPYLIELIAESARRVAGPTASETIPRPSMGSEDFAFYGQHVPAAMFRLGCASESTGGLGLHTPLFDFDEEALRMGARIMAGTALEWLERNAESASPREASPPSDSAS